MLYLTRQVSDSVMVIQKVTHLSQRLFRRGLYSGKRESTDLIKTLVKKYEGGSVDLIKSEFGVAHVVLNNPERRNAMSGSMMVDLLEVVEELETWTDGVGLILRGAENEANTFCSGGDLTTVHRIKGPEMGFRMSVLMNEATERLLRLPLVSACLIQGLAVGGGAELATATDWRLVTSQARVAWVQARMGVAPGWGGARRLVDIVGRQRALDLLLSCRKVDAHTGLKIGLFDHVLEDGLHDQVVSSAVNWIKDMSCNVDPGVMRSLKQMTLNTDPETEARIFAPLWGGPANLGALDRNIKHR